MSESEENGRAREAETARVSKWHVLITVVVILAVAVAAGFVITRLAQQEREETGPATLPFRISTESNAIPDVSSPSPTPTSSAEPPEQSEESYFNGVEKLWEVDIAQQLPDLDEPRAQLADGPSINEPVGPMVLGNVWVIPVKDSHKNRFLVGFGADTGEVLWRLPVPGGRCTPLPADSILGCVDDKGVIFTVDQEGKRSEVATVASERVRDVSIDVWREGAVVTITESKTVHLVGMDQNGNKTWQDNIVDTERWFRVDSTSLSAQGEAFVINLENFSFSRKGEVRSARNGTVLATSQSSIEHVGPKILYPKEDSYSRKTPGANDLILTEAGKGQFEVVSEQLASNLRYLETEDREMLYRIPREPEALPDMCDDLTTASCRRLPYRFDVDDKFPGWGVDLRPVKINDTPYVTRLFLQQGAEKGGAMTQRYTLIPLDQDKPVRTSEITRNAIARFGISQGKNSIMVSSDENNELQITDLGTGAEIGHQVAEGWYPIEKMPADRLLLAKAAVKSRDGSSDGQTAFSAWGPAKKVQPWSFSGEQQERLEKIESCGEGQADLAWAEFDGGWALVCGTTLLSPKSMVINIDGQRREIPDPKLARAEGSIRFYGGFSDGEEYALHTSSRMLSRKNAAGELLEQRRLKTSWYAARNKVISVDVTSESAGEQLRRLIEILRFEKTSSNADSYAGTSPERCSGTSTSGDEAMVAKLRELSRTRAQMITRVEEVVVDRIDGGVELVNRIRQGLAYSATAFDARADMTQAMREGKCEQWTNWRATVVYMMISLEVISAKICMNQFKEYWNTHMVPRYRVVKLEGEIW